MGMTPTHPHLALLALAVALALLSPVCKKPANRPPATPEVPTGVTSGDRDTIYEFRSVAVDPDGDRVALRFAWGNGDTTGWSAWVASGETVNTFHLWDSAGFYEVSAQAKDDSSSLSDWSASRAVAIGNMAPLAPAAPSGPSTLPARRPCWITSVATDPNGDSVALRFCWGKGDTSGWGAWTGSGDSLRLVHRWDSAGTYAVTAQAKDRPGAVSHWSLSTTVAVTIATPRTPLPPVGPSAASANWACRFFASASDPNGNRIALRFAWGDGDTSDWSESVASGDTIRMDHSWSSPDTYHVTVQAKNDSEALSDWSDDAKVTIALPAPGVIKWNYRTQGAASPAAVGSDGTIYFGSNYYLYAVNPDGTLRWHTYTLSSWFTPAAIGPDGTIYAGSSDYYLYALNPDGTVKWRYFTVVYVSTSPSMGPDGEIYFGSGGFYFYALNPDSTLKWRYLPGDDVQSSPAIGADGTIYFGSGDHYLSALNPDGTVKWRYLADGSITSSPAIDSDGTIYVGSYDDHVYALNPDGSLKWRYLADGDVTSSPAIGSDGTIYVGSRDHCVYALNPDGTLRWRYETGDAVTSSPAVATDGTVYVGSDDDYLYALDPDGSLRWRCLMPGDVSSSPAIGPDGMVYVGSESGYMNAVIGSAPLADTPWPKFHHDNRNSGRVGGP
jgi:outer membrane protein assembly factor BamB